MDSSFVAGGRRSAWRPGWIRVRAGQQRADWSARQTRGLAPLSVLPSAPQPLIRHPKPPYQTSKMSLSVDIQNLVAVGGRLSLSLFPLKIIPFPRTAPLPGLAGLTKESIGGILSAASG